MTIVPWCQEQSTQETPEVRPRPADGAEQPAAGQPGCWPLRARAGRRSGKSGGARSSGSPERSIPTAAEQRRKASSLRCTRLALDPGLLSLALVAPAPPPSPASARLFRIRAGLRWGCALRAGETLSLRMPGSVRRRSPRNAVHVQQGLVPHGRGVSSCPARGASLELLRPSPWAFSGTGTANEGGGG